MKPSMCASPSRMGLRGIACTGGVVDPASIRIKHDNVDNPDTWHVDLTVVDSVQLLERVTVRAFMNNKLTHASYDVINGTSYVTFYGYHAASNTTTDKYEVDEWYLENLGTAHTSYTDPTRFIRIVDILEALGEYLGLEGDINNGGTWTNFVTSKFAYGDSADLQWIDFDHVYVHAGWYNSGASAYYQVGTFFHDPAGTDGQNNQPKTSFLTMGSPYDLLKSICTSLGLQFGVRINTSNQRYLYVADASREESPAITISSNSNVYDVETTPYLKRITGCEVVSSDGPNIVRGANGNESVKVDCIFTFLNVYRNEEQNFVASTGKTRPYVRSSSHMLALWGTKDDIDPTPTTPTSKGSVPALYSLCVFKPYQNSVAGKVDGFGYGELDGSSEIQYPAISGASNLSCAIPAMALAHMTFSPFDITTDPLGRFRVLGEQISLKAKLASIITLSQVNVTPEFSLTVTIGGTAYTYLISDVTWKLFDNEVEMKGERRW